MKTDPVMLERAVAARIAESMNNDLDYMMNIVEGKGNPEDRPQLSVSMPDLLALEAALAAPRMVESALLARAEKAEAGLATLRGRVEKLYKTGFIAQLPFTGNKHSISWCEGFGAGRDAVKAAIKKDILDGRGVK